VFVLELRHVEPRYVIKIMRSPDGEQREYTIGSMSIQRAALWILEQYYKDFSIYNPWLELAHRKRAVQLMQLEQINRKGGDNADTESIKSRKSMKSYKAAKGKENPTGYNLTANDRLYEEYEYDKRLKRRKAKLLQVTEEAFGLVRRDFNLGDSQSLDFENKKSLMDPYEAAQAVFTSIARDLRRYLRITKQQPFFTREGIVSHLADCISYDMTPKAFLQRYVEGESLVFNERAMMLNEQRLGGLDQKAKEQTWILISDLALYQSLENDLMFVLKQNEVSLMCTVKRLPRFNLIEDVLDPKRNKFVLKINSETTV
jgi:vang-like